MSDPKLPGRPPLDDADPSVGVYVRMPSRQYDDLYTKAHDERVSVPEIIRRSLDATKPDRSD